MPEFLTLLPPPEALALFLERLPIRPTAEPLPTEAALGRVTATAVTAPFALPSFARSTVDGYAVRARETHGASESLPAYLTLAGEVLMGQAPSHPLEQGQCALIHTGGMLPAEADAVVMVEFTRQVREGEIEVLRAVGSGENLLKVGEDVQEGEVVIPAGVRLRPAEIGGLMALGQTEVAVSRRPLVGIISSGDEIVPPDQPLATGQVYDVNSYTLQALVTQAGGQPHLYGIVGDDPHTFRQVAEEAHHTCDLVIFTAGSSVSVRDLTAQTIAALGPPGILVHGVNVRPGKPTILALCAGVPVIGLPGNPVSALIVAELFVRPTIEALLGAQTRPKAMITARLTVNLSSQAGREDWVGVRLKSTQEGTLAEPVWGKSNLIFTLAQADGLVRIPPAANGVAAGEIVDVMLM